MLIINPTQMLRRGLRLIGIRDATQRGRNYQTNVEYFKDHFGKHPLHLCRVWRDLQTTNNPDAHMDATEKYAFLGFLAALNFLKCYQKTKNRVTVFKVNFVLHEKLIRQLSWRFVRRIAALKNEKIVWPDDNEWDTINIVSVDGTHARTNEPRDPDMKRNKIWYSHKDDHPGLGYEIALDLWRNRIVHSKTSGEPASVGDLVLFRQELMGKIPAGKRVIADRGYICAEHRDVLSTPNHLDSDQVKEFKRRARARHETINARMKAFKCLDVRFRHRLHKHQWCFDAVLVLTQYAIEDTGPHGEPLFDI